VYAVLNRKHNFRSTYCSEANDRHEASRGLIATAELLVFNHDDYLTSLIIAGIDNFQARREHRRTEQFFLRHVLKEQAVKVI